MDAEERLAQLLPTECLVADYEHRHASAPMMRAASFPAGAPGQAGQWPDAPAVAVSRRAAGQFLGSAHVEGGRLQHPGAIATTPSKSSKFFSSRTHRPAKQHHEHQPDPQHHHRPPRGRWQDHHGRPISAPVPGTSPSTRGWGVRHGDGQQRDEKERGITILAKNRAVTWKGMHINIVDTPGHAGLRWRGGARAVQVDDVVLLIDAQEGPMPQTRLRHQEGAGPGPQAHPWRWSTRSTSRAHALTMW